MAGILSSLFGSHADAGQHSGPDSNSATVSVEDIQRGGEVETEEDGVQGAQSFHPSFNDPTDGGAGDATLSPLGPPTDAYLESQ